jgi:hypothetical protein
VTLEFALDGCFIDVHFRSFRFYFIHGPGGHAKRMGAPPPSGVRNRDDLLRQSQIWRALYQKCLHNASAPPISRSNCHPIPLFLISQALFANICKFPHLN